MTEEKTINTVRTIYRDELKYLYDTNEIDSIYSIILEEKLSLDRTQQFLKAEEKLKSEHVIGLLEILEKLKTKIPIQYILGKADFYGLEFVVNKSVLIPRQETELLVDLIIKSNKGKTLSIIDIGTGSGCIAISIKKNLPDALLTAVDISEDALTVARENARNNQVEISFAKVDILNPADLSKYDIIVSNPPYVKEHEKKAIHDNVLMHEPHLALFVPDEDPLMYYRAIANFGKTHLKDDGEIWLEINEALGNETKGMYLENGYKNAEVIKDLNGKDRIVKVKG